MLHPAQHDRPQAPGSSAGAQVCHRVKAEKYIKRVVKTLQHHIMTSWFYPTSSQKHSAQEVPHLSSGWCYFLWPGLQQKQWQTSDQGLQALPQAAPP